MLNILDFFPKHISEIIFKNIDKFYHELEEIRIRQNKPIILKFSNQELLLEYYPNNEEVLRILQLVCDNSIYAYQNQICKRIYNYKRWA